MAEALLQQKQFNTFYNAFVHITRPNGKTFYDATLSGTTYAVVWWTFNDKKMPPFQEKSEKQHAELNVIVTLKTKIGKQKRDPNTKPTVKIIISFSPCAQCSKALIAFKESSDVEVELVFASLYKIRRASCCEDKHICEDHLKFADKQQSEDNEQGLRDMVAAKIVLRTFLQNDWHTLEAELKVNGLKDFNTRQKEDKRMANDLRVILEKKKVPDLVDGLLGPLERTSLQENPPTTSGAGGDRTSPDTTKGSLLKKRYRDETSPEQPQK